ncbi:MAG: response regulator [Treponema sp.]|jgi:putative two-component system response regulator|nr:response regulator [Treponema sp.]
MDNATRPSVLVVDDEEINVMLLEGILEDEYTVITANDGTEALDILWHSKVLPKVVLLDVQMRKMGGFETLKNIKADDSLKRIPVIFITADKEESRALAAGAVDYISKPPNPDVVRLRVKNQIELKNYSDHLEELVEEKTAEIMESMDVMLQAMANIIEYRNLESGSHVKRVQLYSESLIDQLMSRSSKYVEYAYQLKILDPDIIIKSVALHDVGKIGIPDKILLKPGKLDPDEFEIMKTHTTLGKKIVESMLKNHEGVYLQHCRDIAYCHHERFDGKGYPRGIAGYDIPLAARIASVADVYDALVCARVYKAAFSYEDAIKIIIDGSGAQFDPILTKVLVDIQDEFIAISEAYK